VTSWFPVAAFLSVAEGRDFWTGVCASIIENTRSSRLTFGSICYYSYKISAVTGQKVYSVSRQPAALLSRCDTGCGWTADTMLYSGEVQPAKNFEVMRSGNLRYQPD